MSDFSNYLLNFIKQNNLSLKEAASLCKQDYSLMSRFTTGKRLPASVSATEEIAAYLHMTTHETEEFINFYNQEKIGSINWNSYKLIEHILKNLDNVLDINKKKFPQLKYQNVEPINTPILPLASNHEIFDTIAYCLYYFSSDDKIPVYSLLQPDDKLNELFINHPMSDKISLTQIICIDHDNEDSALTNLKILNQLLPILYFSFETDFYYYYESVNNHLTNYSLLPYMIIIGKYAIRFNKSITYGELITIPEIVNVLKKQFDNILKSCNKLTNKLNSAYEHTMYLQEHESFNTTARGIHGWPCIGQYLSRDIYENQLHANLPDRAMLIEMLCSFNNYSENFHPATATTFMSRQGVENFMKTGLIMEFPSKYYSPIDMTTRKLIISRMIKAIEKQHTYCYLAKEDFIIPEKIGINFTPGWLCLKDVASEDVSGIMLFETGITKILIEYSQYCIDTNKVHTIEETVQYLKSVIGG